MVFQTRSRHGRLSLPSSALLLYFLTSFTNFSPSNCYLLPSFPIPSLTATPNILFRSLPCCFAPNISFPCHNHKWLRAWYIPLGFARISFHTTTQANIFLFLYILQQVHDSCPQCEVSKVTFFLYYIKNQQDATLAVLFISHCKKQLLLVQDIIKNVFNIKSIILIHPSTLSPLVWHTTLVYM